MRRCPSPRACSSSASPITSVASRRRGIAHAANSTCVVPQDWQHARLGLIERIPSRIRTCRSRAKPQRASGPSQAGQHSRPAARSASTTSGSAIIANTPTPAFPVTLTRLAAQLAHEQGRFVLEDYQTSCPAVQRHRDSDHDPGRCRRSSPPAGTRELRTTTPPATTIITALSSADSGERTRDHAQWR